MATRDPLEQFRRRQEPRQIYEQAQGSDEHRALRAAIEALNQIPNTPLSGEYKNTYALIPVLETVYRNAEKARNQTIEQPAQGVQLEQHPGFSPMTDAEIEAAAGHDIDQWGKARQDRMQEPDIEP